MATPKPKTFIAQRKFSVAGQTFKKGGVVTGRPLSLVLGFGDKFVAPERPKNPDTPKEQSNGDQ